MRDISRPCFVAFRAGAIEQEVRSAVAATPATAPRDQHGGPARRDEPVRGEYMTMLWYLLLIVAAIDRRTVHRRRVGVVADNAIILTADELWALGLRKGPSSKHGGHAGRAYYELSA